MNRFRRRPRLSSVRARTTAVAVIIVGVVLVVWGMSLVLIVGRSVNDEVVDGHRMLRTIVASAEAGTLAPVIPVPGGKDDDDVFAQVVNGNHQVVAASQNYVGQPPVTDRRPRPGERLQSTIDGAPPVDIDDEFRLISTRVAGPDGPLFVYVGTEIQPVQQTVESLSQALALGAPGLLLVSAALVWLVIGRSLRPVEQIRLQVAEISEAELDRRVPVPPVDDEIARLARTMNGMLDRLQISAERQRRFVADASHELRSPLAISRTQLEIAAAHPEATDWPATAEDLLDENKRMERLVADLAFLARRDERGPEATAGPVPLHVLVRDEVQRRRTSSRMLFEDTRVSPAVVDGQSDHLARVLRNLLDNAERHARSRIAVAVTRREGHVNLVVADDGDGVAPQDRESVFGRFARLDEARSRDEGGSGLGLAIVRDIVSAHGGEVWVEDGPGGGAQFVVRLPVQPPFGSSR